MDSSSLVALAPLRIHGMTSFYFAAKAPLAGRAKTRLGMAIGMSAAAALYAAFLRDLTARFAHAPFGVHWCVEPGAQPHLRPFIGSATLVRTQRGQSWAERQANLFRDCAGASEARVVLAATDSPQLTTQRVEQAFDALDSHDAVFGPTYDGGFYLVGMSGFHDILEGVEMSTRGALDGVLARAHGLDVSLLDAEFDVDTADDLDRLAREVARRNDLNHTAAALASIRGIAEEPRIA